MRNRSLSQPRGSIGTHELFILGAVTLIAAIIIIIVFIALSGKNQEQIPTQNILDTLPTKNTSTNNSTSESTKQDQGTGEVKYPTKTYSGTLTAIQGAILTLMNPDTKETYQVTLTKESKATYQGNSFDTAKLHQGDQLLVDAQLKTGTWQAVAITVLLAASPEVPAVVPEKVNVRPDGSIKPL